MKTTAFNNYPEIADYFGANCKSIDDSPITSDIETLKMVLPIVMRASDGEEDLVSVGQTIGYVICNLVNIRKDLINGRDELKEGGAA